jgi:acyl-coenzyme A thioesterase PaaI-like protein
MYNHTYKEIIATLQVSQQDIDFFANMPFARPYIDKISPYQPVPFVSRYDKGDLSDKFFNIAIKSNDTILRALAFIRKLGSLHSPPTDEKGKDLSYSVDNPFFITFCQIESGVNSYINTVHGGVLAALFNETLGFCAEAYRVFVSLEGGHLLTAKLKVSYRLPMPTPSTVVIKTWVRRKEGRKWFLKA